MSKQNKILNIAHRGSSLSCPENTLASFQTAVKEGSDYLEIDVRLSKDKQLVVIHDRKINRTSNQKGRVRKYTLNELKRLDIGSWFHSDFKSQRISTLEEILKHFNTQGFIIDVKELAIEKYVVSALSNYDCTNIIISSFHWVILKKFKKLNPQLKLAILIPRKFGWKRKLKKAHKLGFYSVHIEQSILNPNMVKEAKSLGLKLIPWTFRYMHEGRLRQILSYNPHGLINDYPKTVEQYLN
ncbi:MAG: hypothetical protein COB02_14395 [Candidatus Cloacimonadota bacterium]|nr:MAG: hypothetical protein COB02_14395 [Candidatus Cloacimonadota bacterium]